MRDKMTEEIRVAKIKFRYQRSRANQRGIPFLLTFEQWYEWWQSTGHWHERGNTKGKYVMSRYGDLGPYSLDNIFCQTTEDNTREGNVKLRGIVRSDETRQRMSESFKGKPKLKNRGTNNHFHKDNLTDELRQKILEGQAKKRKPVVTPHGRFESLTSAAKNLNVDPGTIGYRMKVKPMEYYYEKNQAI